MKLEDFKTGMWVELTSGVRAMVLLKTRHYSKNIVVYECSGFDILETIYDRIFRVYSTTGYSCVFSADFVCHPINIVWERPPSKVKVECEGKVTYILREEAKALNLI